MNEFIVLTLSIFISILSTVLQKKSFNSIRHQAYNLNELVTSVLCVITVCSYTFFDLNLNFAVFFFVMNLFFCIKCDSEELKKCLSSMSLIIVSFICLNYLEFKYINIAFVLILNVSTELLLRYKKSKVSIIRLFLSLVILSKVYGLEIRSFLFIAPIYMFFEYILFRKIKRIIPLSFRPIDYINTRALQLCLIVLALGVFIKWCTSWA